MFDNIDINSYFELNRYQYIRIVYLLVSLRKIDRLYFMVKEQYN